MSRETFLRSSLNKIAISAICLAISLPGMAGERVVKLSPKIRISDTATGVMPEQLQKAIKPFLKRDIVIDGQALNQYPYIVAFPEEHITATKGEKLYARGNFLPTISSYSVIRLSEPYIDPMTHQVLGTAAEYVATAELQKIADPATLTISNFVTQVIIGDRLVPSTATAADLAFVPHPAKAKIADGMIISLLGTSDGLAQAGKYSAVVINRGARDGVQLGDTLGIFSKGGIARDSVVEGTKPVEIPSERIGELMVFKVYDRLSFALVTDSTSNIQLNDLVGNS